MALLKLLAVSAGAGPSSLAAALLLPLLAAATGGAGPTSQSLPVLLLAATTALRLLLPECGPSARSWPNPLLRVGLGPAHLTAMPSPPCTVRTQPLLRGRDAAERRSGAVMRVQAAAMPHAGRRDRVALALAIALAAIITRAGALLR